MKYCYLLWKRSEKTKYQKLVDAHKLLDKLIRENILILYKKVVNKRIIAVRLISLVSNKEEKLEDSSQKYRKNKKI